MNQWLIRTSQNMISGPFTAEQVRKKILDAELKSEDEICQANHFWIFIYETKEVEEQLGIKVPAYVLQNRAKDEDEVTETATEPQTPTLAAKESPDDIPDLPEIPDDEIHASVMSATAHRDRDTRIRLEERNSNNKTSTHSFNSTHTSSGSKTSTTVPQIEKLSLWKGVAIALASVAIILVFMIIRVLTVRM